MATARIAQHTETEQERSPHPTSPVVAARIAQQIQTISHTETEQERSPNPLWLQHALHNRYRQSVTQRQNKRGVHLPHPLWLQHALHNRYRQSVTQRQNKRGVQIPCGYSTHCTTDTDNQSHRDRTREESKSPVATARIAQQIQTISHTETEQERSPNPLWLQHALHNRYRQSVTQRQNKRGVQIPCGYSTHCTTDTDNQSHRDRTREESKSPVATARIAQQIQTISHTETEQERSPNPLWLQHALHNRYRQSVTQRQNKRGVQIPCGYSTHCTTDTDNQSHRDRTREESKSPVATARIAQQTQTISHTETEQERSPNPLWLQHALHNRYRQSVTQRQNKRGVQIPCGYSTHCTTDTDNQSHRDRTREESKSPVATAHIAQQIQTISHTETEQERSPNPLWLQHTLHNRYRQSVTQRQNKRGVQIPCGYSTHCTTDTDNQSHRDRTREESKSPVATAHIAQQIQTISHTETEQERSPNPLWLQHALHNRYRQSVTQRQNKRGVQIPCGYSTHCTTDTDNQSHRDRTREESKSPVATARIVQQIQTISHTETEQERSPNPLWLQHALHNRYRQSVTQRQNKRGVQIPCGYSTHCTTDTDNQSNRDRTREESKSPVATARIAQQIQGMPAPPDVTAAYAKVHTPLLLLLQYHCGLSPPPVFSSSFLPHLHCPGLHTGESSDSSKQGKPGRGPGADEAQVSCRRDPHPPSPLPSPSRKLIFHVFQQV